MPTTLPIDYRAMKKQHDNDDNDAMLSSWMITARWSWYCAVTTNVICEELSSITIAHTYSGRNMWVKIKIKCWNVGTDCSDYATATRKNIYNAISNKSCGPGMYLSWLCAVCGADLRQLIFAQTDAHSQI